MTRTIDTTVKADADVHIGIVVFPMTIDTIRFYPLTDTGRKILRMDCDRYRLSVSRDIGNDIYDQLGAAGYQVCEHRSDCLDQSCKWDCDDIEAWVRESSNRPHYSEQPE